MSSSGAGRTSTEKIAYWDAVRRTEHDMAKRQVALQQERVEQALQHLNNARADLARHSEKTHELKTKPMGTGTPEDDLFIEQIGPTTRRLTNAVTEAKSIFASENRQLDIKLDEEFVKGKEVIQKKGFRYTVLSTWSDSQGPPSASSASSASSAPPASSASSTPSA